MHAQLQRVVAAWMRWWFEAPDLRPLILVRIVLGCAILLTYGTQAGHLAEFLSNEGWMPVEALRERPYRPSLLFYLTTPTQVTAAWLVLLGCALAFTLGRQTAWTKWVLWALHASFQNRAPLTVYGIDDIIANLLFLMCFAPIERGQVLTKGTAKYERASAVLRLIQLQMAVVFFFAGVEKVRGTRWWQGDAVWFALTDIEFRIFPLEWFATRIWLINLMTYGSLLTELSYPFRIWDRNTRPIFLTAAIGLHVGIAVLMGLHEFGLAMIAGHLAFTPPAWLDRLWPGADLSP